MVLRPDKCSPVIIMITGDYTIKMRSILDDQLSFKVDKSKWVPTNHWHAKRTSKINSIYNDLSSLGSHLPHVCDLPKVQKDDVLLRPILSTIESMYHKVTSQLAEKLELVCRRIAAYTWRDSFQVTDRLNLTNVADNFMVSSDATSLFIRIPLLKLLM